MKTRISTCVGVVLLSCGPCLQVWAQATAGSTSAPASSAVTGSGKTYFIPIWTNSTTLSSSTLFEKSSKVGIGTTTPGATLEVNGTAKFDQAVTFASGQTFSGTASLGANTFVGNQGVTGDVTASGQVQGGVVSATASFDIGGTAFAFGSPSLSNAFLGFAGNSTTTGTDNTATGIGALSNNTTGYNNIANGVKALEFNTTGWSNNASGVGALGLNTSGNNNIATGNQTLFSNTTGYGNTATGGYALQLNSTGIYNTGVGYYTLSANSAGAQNTALGYLAGTNLEGTLPANGYNATSVGAGATATVDNLQNATAIGACATVSVSNALVLGMPAGSCFSITTTNTNVGIDVPNPGNILTILQGGGPAISDGWSTYSSRRWKSDIQPLQGALGKVERLRGVSYTYATNGKHDIGMIAEEVGKVVPEVVSYEDNGKDARGIDYARLTALLVEAIKQQQAEIRHEQAQINRLKSEVRALQEKR